MMGSKTFEFDPDFWFSNRALRGCSPAARGFWLDLLAIMRDEGGYLTVNGRAIDDSQLARMIGEPVASIRKWIRELGEARIFSVSDDGRMYASRMVRKAQFADRAKVHGQSGQRKRREKKPADPAPAWTEERDIAPPQVAADPDVQPSPLPQVKAPTMQLTRRAVSWWKTPAGWVKHGLQQALSMKPDEAFEEFQCRLAARIPPGVHLDVLTPTQKRMVEALRPKDPSAQAGQ